MQMLAEFEKIVIKLLLALCDFKVKRQNKKIIIQIQ